ncbi:hypothetical protein [Haladaptatus salinisoli]|uniref:hypothetical protein n=1 Tax=Haladaptatus salinisoli TaxID=2884876 RepID=UPI001D0BCD4B|nr:hypothetical protein [Haladaptatus salinisoli]
MASFDRGEYRRVVRRLANDVHERMAAGMSTRSALYRSVGECVVDLWNFDVSLRICELSERDPEIEVVAEVVSEDASDTHADYEVYVRAMAFSVLSQDVRETVENTVRTDAEVPNSRDAGELTE